MADDIPDIQLPQQQGYYQPQQPLGHCADASSTAMQSMYSYTYLQSATNARITRAVAAAATVTSSAEVITFA